MGLSLALSYFVFLMSPIVFSGAAKSNLDGEFKAGLKKATKCLSKSPPKEPVMALSPARYSQLVAFLRKTSKAPSCGGIGAGSTFHYDNPKTWPFCALGNCVNEKCQCVSSYTGPSCGEFSGKCWMMYCFLTSCVSSFQNLHCKCDAVYYGLEVLSGEYWYDDGKKSSYVPPPPNWKDTISGIVGSAISSGDIHGKTHAKSDGSLQKKKGHHSSVDGTKTGHSGGKSSGKNGGQGEAEAGGSGKLSSDEGEQSDADEHELEDVDEEEQQEESSSKKLTPGFLVSLLVSFSITQIAHCV